MDIRIRPATLDDLDILLEFEQGIIEAEIPMDETIITDKKVHYYDLPAFIESPDTLMLVAEHDGEVVGCGYGKIMESPAWSKEKAYGHVGFMFVKEAFRGNGISNRIIDRLCAWFRENNVNEARLRVYEKNPGAISSYKRSGFTEMRREMWMKLE